tara:strand:+ start:2662 stop:2841 length:180 start_codon:yes stop_codon:yes gene_type:complete
MKIDTYHETQAKLDQLTSQAIEQGNRDVANGLEDLSARLRHCWSITVKKEAESTLSCEK